ncbi:MAG: peptide chain release factor N(5)-glutamine methyltransferase [Candidatus Rokubacteria bacterium]|nr:peptide chain release factor N(5)-glutamine methyltransferase [Candidatus Rokubacteria bacterium]
MKTLAVEPTVGGLLAEGAAELESVGLATARQDSEWLLAEALGVDRLALWVEPGRPVSRQVATGFRGRIRRRMRHEPLQYILGFEEFRGLRLRMTPAALIPRPETELLVEWALELEDGHGPWSLAVDIGTGSGAIACALAAGAPHLHVLAVESSMAALAVAAANISTLGLAPRVRLVAGDLFEPLAGLANAVDVVISNPPYIRTSDLAALPIEIRDWEPHAALDGGADGTAVHRRLIGQSPGFLAPGGWLLMEVGEGQAETLRQAMAAHGFERIEVRKDLRGIERMIGGRRG